MFQDDYEPMPMYNESPGARQRRLQRERKEQTERQQQMEVVISMFICAYIFFNLIIYRAETNCGRFKTWLLWSLFFYILDAINCLNQLMFIMKTGRESLRFMLGMYIILLANASWYIYGNVLYYQNQEMCLHPVNAADGAEHLTSAMFVMIIIGYMTLCKCCCITTFLCIAIPCLIRIYRQANRPNWEQAAPGLLRRLATGKFQAPDAEANGGEIPSCIICMAEYTEEDTVITLPCDKRHYFHDACIKEWLTRNNACPLCKKPITEEDIKRQKKELQRTAASAANN